MRPPGSYSAALRAARAAADLAPVLLPGTAATVRANLRLAFGKFPARLPREIYRHFAAAAVDLIWFDRLFDPGRFDRHFRFEGGALEHFRKTRPPAAVFATGHFGNWELFGAAFRHVGIPLAPVARPPGRAWLARRMERFRVEHGQETISKLHALPLALRALRAGRCVAFLMDQAAGRHGPEVPFFGRPARTFTAPAVLARKLDLPLYAGYSTRMGDGIAYRCFAERVALESDDIATTRKLNRIFEGYIRARPEQWWWFHRRFKPPRAERAGARVGPAGIPIRS